MMHTFQRSYNIHLSTILSVQGESIIVKCICMYVTGLWLHNSGSLGASPDGLIRVPAAHGYVHQDAAVVLELGEDNIKPEVLEIKCPFSARHLTIPEAIQQIKDFCLGT